MTILRNCLISLALTIFIAARSYAADLPPPPQDAKLASVYEQAKLLFEKSKTKGYLEMPSNPKPWPCEVTESELKQFAGLHEQDANDEKIANKILGDAGLNGNYFKTTYVDVRYAPIVATCKNGKLDGSLEFIIEYTVVNKTPDYTSQTRQRSRGQRLLAMGKTLNASPIILMNLDISNKTTYKDPSWETFMPKTKISSTSYSEQNAEHSSYSALIIETITNQLAPEWTTTFSWPTGAKTTESTTYRGKALFTTNKYKNNFQHGEQRTYPSLFNGVPMPGSVECYENGEEIKTTKCDVE